MSPLHFLDDKSRFAHSITIIKELPQNAIQSYMNYEHIFYTRNHNVYVNTLNLIKDATIWTTVQTLATENVIWSYHQQPNVRHAFVSSQMIKKYLQISIA